MNFVVFSWNFPPMNDAEAYCTARFASALAQTGNDVCVVTMGHPDKMSRDTYDFLVQGVRVVRIPLSPVRSGPLFPRLRYFTSEWGSVDFRRAILTLSKVLRETERPILVSRSSPLNSHIVAWNCRKIAYRWIAHFSDPFPWLTSKKTIGARFRDVSNDFWGKRVVRGANGISLTCEQVQRYYEGYYGSSFSKKCVFVTPHIGEPKLPCSAQYEHHGGIPLIVHAGQLNRDRGVEALITAINELNANGLPCEFKQIGQVARDVISLFRSSPMSEVVADRTPGLATAMVDVASACFIPDLQTHLSYSPFLPSKFVYQVFTDTPLVLYSVKESALCGYAKDFPSAGLFFADVKEPGSLAEAFRSALSANRVNFDRTELRKVFSRRKIATDFIKHVERVI